MAAARFDGDDAGYLAWREANLSGGYVLNVDEVASEGSRLHRAGCRYLERPINDGKQLTHAYPKICSTDPADLLPLLGTGRRCSPCMP